MTELTEDHRVALTKYTIGELKDLIARLDYPKDIEIDRLRVNVEALDPNFGAWMGHAGSHIAEAQDMLQDVIDSLQEKLPPEEEKTTNE